MNVEPVNDQERKPRRHLEVDFHVSADNMADLVAAVGDIFQNVSTRENVVTHIITGGVSWSWWAYGTSDPEADLDSYLRHIEQLRLERLGKD